MLLTPSGTLSPLTHVRAEAVMPEVNEAEVEIRHPKDLGMLEFRFGHPGTSLCGGDDQRPGIGKP